MLSRAQRVTRAREFSAVVRGGRRAGTRTLVAHLALDEHAVDGAESMPRAGFVVGKAVGPAVVRNRVKRRLRHAVRGRLAGLPTGSSLVVRALPPAGSASWPQLESDLDSVLGRLVKKGRSA